MQQQSRVLSPPLQQQYGMRTQISSSSNGMMNFDGNRPDATATTSSSSATDINDLRMEAARLRLARQRLEAELQASRYSPPSSYSHSPLLSSATSSASRPTTSPSSSSSLNGTAPPAASPHHHRQQQLSPRQNLTSSSFASSYLSPNSSSSRYTTATSPYRSSSPPSLPSVSSRPVSSLTAAGSILNEVGAGRTLHESLRAARDAAIAAEKMLASASPSVSATATSSLASSSLPLSSSSSAVNGLLSTKGFSSPRSTSPISSSSTPTSSSSSTTHQFRFASSSSSTRPGSAPTYGHTTTLSGYYRSNSPPRGSGLLSPTSSATTTNSILTSKPSNIIAMARVMVSPTSSSSLSSTFSPSTFPPQQQENGQQQQQQQQQPAPLPPPSSTPTTTTTSLSSNSSSNLSNGGAPLHPRTPPDHNRVGDFGASSTITARQQPSDTLSPRVGPPSPSSVHPVLHHEPRHHIRAIETVHDATEHACDIEKQVESTTSSPQRKRSIPSNEEANRDAPVASSPSSSHGGDNSTSASAPPAATTAAADHQLQQLQALVKELTGKLEHKEHELKLSQSSCKALETQLLDLTTKVAEREEVQRNADERVKETEEKCFALQMAKDSAEATVRQVTDESEAKNAELSKRIEDLEAENARSLSSVREHEDRIAQLESELAAAKSNIVEAPTRPSDAEKQLREQLESTIAERDAMAQNNIDAEKQIASLVEKVAELEKVRDELQLRIEQQEATPKSTPKSAGRKKEKKIQPQEDGEEEEIEEIVRDDEVDEDDDDDDFIDKSYLEPGDEEVEEADENDDEEIVDEEDEEEDGAKPNKRQQQQRRQKRRDEEEEEPVEEEMKSGLSKEEQQDADSQFLNTSAQASVEDIRKAFETKLAELDSVEDEASQQKEVEKLQAAFGRLVRQKTGVVKARPAGHRVAITLEEAYSGAEKIEKIVRLLVCQRCRGHGVKDAESAGKCESCDGRGMAEGFVPTPFGMQRIRQPCVQCEGTGVVVTDENRCEACHAQRVIRKEGELKVIVPAGARQGQRLIMPGEGDIEPGTVPGDRIILIYELPHEKFKRVGDNLFVGHSVHILDALDGSPTPLVQLDGSVLAIKSEDGGCIPPGGIFAVRGAGMRIRNPKDEKTRGDLFVEIAVDFPSELSEEATAEIKQVLSSQLPPEPLQVPEDSYECWLHPASEQQIGNEGHSNTQEDDDPRETESPPQCQQQ